MWEGDCSGYVRVFSLDSNNEASTNGTWKQIGQDIIREAIGDEFRISVSIFDNGLTIAFGVQSQDIKNEDYLGHVQIYHLEDNSASWVQIRMDIDGDMAGDWSGTLVSLSANGSVVAIKAPGAGIDDVQTGQVKVYS